MTHLGAATRISRVTTPPAPSRLRSVSSPLPPRSAAPPAAATPLAPLGSTAGGGRPLALRCNARRPQGQWDQDDVADRVAEQVERSVRKAMRSAESDISRARASADKGDVAAQLADKVEQAIRAVQKNPVQVAVMVGGGLMLGSMVIGPVIAALSLAGFVAAASAFSGLAFGAIFLSVGVAMSFSMFSLFGAMALPLLAPLFTFAAVFVALRAVLPKQSSNDTSKQQMETPAEARAQTEAEREAAEKLKKKVEEEMRRKEVEDELRAFDTLLESRTKYSDLDKRS